MEKINWREFNKETFQEAQEKDIPVLLSLSASWCHWCHVMDRTSYSDHEIVDYINNNYVPIRVDSDKRPDINDRYNMGGWPTTAFLTPEGHVMTGATYIPPQEMKTILQDIHVLYKEQKPDIIKQINAIKTRQEIKETKDQVTDLSEDIYRSCVKHIKDSFDEKYGGFGKAPKFPMVGALELAVHQWLNFGDEESGKIFTKTLKAISTGGTFDHEEGGFFRYSTTRDWSIPHFEKMLEDNGALLRLLCVAWQATGEEVYIETLKKVLQWLDNTLYLPDTKCWAGSQDADEHYYSLSLDKRQGLTPPSVDKDIYVNWNAQLAENLLLVSLVLNEELWRERALATLASLEKLCYGEEKGYAHYYDGKKAEIYGLLTDQVSVGRALAAAYQHTGNRKYLEQSERLALWCIKRLRTKEGGFLDSLPDPDATGEMAVPIKDLEQNAKTASWLLLLANLDEGEKFGEEAEFALQAFTGTFERHGLMASSYAMAVFLAKKPWIKVELTGQAETDESRELLNAALKTYAPNKAIKHLTTERNKTAKAYLCRGSQCYQPLTSPKELGEMIRRLACEKIHV